MSDLLVLQEGRVGRQATETHMRRLRWLRRIATALLAIGLSTAGMLAFMASAATGPASIVAPKPAHAAITPKPLRNHGYGIALAPARDRINLRFRLPLRSGLLFDVRSGRVLWERDPTAVLPIASLTKMMTALVVTEHSKPSDSALVTWAAVHFTGSGVGLLPQGKWVPELALLYGLLLPSGNDAAIALAQHVAVTQAHFLAMMNERARQMHLTCSHFTSVSGIVDQGNHSCATDLAYLAHALLAQPLLRRIVGSSSAVVPFPIKGGKLYLYNNNPLLRVGFRGTDGVKTGYTDAAGHCLVATARRGRAWLGVVLLHSGDTLDQAERLLDAGFAALRA